MTEFVDERLLDCVAYGSQFGHVYNTRIKRLRSGIERRNAQWSAPLHRGLILYQNLLSDHHAVVISTHHACMGSLVGFRFKDWSDYTAENEPIGTYDGSSEQDFQLYKTYSFGTIQLIREIKKPVTGTVIVYADGIETPATIDYETGIVSVTADYGELITWSGEFDVPVRFETDEIDFSADNRSGGGLVLNSDIGIIEIRL